MSEARLELGQHLSLPLALLSEPSPRLDPGLEELFPLDCLDLQAHQRREQPQEIEKGLFEEKIEGERKETWKPPM